MFFKKPKLNSNHGYSLIELAVVVGIISVMSVLFLTNYSVSKRRAAVDRSAQKLVMDLRRAQNMAMATAKFGGQIPLGGYGINIGAVLPVTSYVIFADLDNDKQYDAPGELVSTGTLETGVRITGAGFQNLVFVPPDPQICVNRRSSVLAAYCPDGMGAAVSLTITVNYAGLPSRFVRINTITGQITANQ